MKFAATFYKKRRCAIIAIRKKQLTVRFTEEEYAALKGKCEIAGMKMEPFVRALVDGCRIKPAPPDSYNKLRQQLSAIGNNLNQLTHVANVMPPDYMGDAVTITMDAVAAATAPEITEEMYEQLDYLEKHPEENYYENEENFSQYDQGD